MDSPILKRNKDGSYPFQYTPAVKTDIRQTFERVRRQQEPVVIGVDRGTAGGDVTVLAIVRR